MGSCRIGHDSARFTSALDCLGFWLFSKTVVLICSAQDAAAGSKTENHVADWSGFQLALHIRLGRLSDRFRPDFNNISTYQTVCNTTLASVQYLRLRRKCLY